MASPSNPPHPLTPPAEPAASSSTQQTSTLQQQSQQPTSASQVEAILSQPATSLTDDGKSRRPRDHRLVHLLLASHGITAYQERVPLQLMDFAYRYTSSVLGDALHIQNEGYDQVEGGSQQPGGRGRGGGAGGSKGGTGAQNKAGGGDEGDLSLSSLRLAIGSRMAYQFQTNMPKDFLKGVAEERNRIGLAVGMRDSDKGGPTIAGVKLPHERYCLTGVGWGLKEEWDSEGEETVDEEGDAVAPAEAMQMDGPEDLGEDEEGEDGGGTMEDVFGTDDAADATAGDSGDDAEMEGT